MSPRREVPDGCPRDVRIQTDVRETWIQTCPRVCVRDVRACVRECVSACQTVSPCVCVCVCERGV